MMGNSRYRWHEIGLCLVCLVLSVLHFVGPNLATASVMNPWVWHMFYSAQGLGAVVALISIFWRRPSVHGETLLKVEQSGMLLVASAGIIYATAVFMLTGGGWQIVPGESLVLFMWVGASLARAWQIRTQLREFRNGGP